MRTHLLQIFLLSTLPNLSYLAQNCNPSLCHIEDNCRCSSDVNPISGTDPAPQLLAITVSESIVENIYNEYLGPLFFGRKNPDGSPIGLSFYVNHEYTDYILVQDLYLRGYEIGVHSITKNSSQAYWRGASLEDLVEEFGGQRQIISKFANIPISDVLGARFPQLQLEGDIAIDAYMQSGITYDNSWPTRSTSPLLPYTLDYLSTEQCQVSTNCPTESHPGFWIAPITNIKGQNNVECNSLAACLESGTAEEIASWLLNTVNNMRSNNRAPLIVRLDSYWFSFTDNSYEGFQLFLDRVARLNDVFLVSVQDILNWIKAPASVSNFKRNVNPQQTTCNRNTCNLFDLSGNVRYMRSCVPCPDQYPWKGNPLGKV